jgi:hypothetical protein
VVVESGWVREYAHVSDLIHANIFSRPIVEKYDEEFFRRPYRKIEGPSNDSSPITDCEINGVAVHAGHLQWLVVRTRNRNIVGFTCHDECSILRGPHRYFAALMNWLKDSHQTTAVEYASTSTPAGTSTMNP